MFTAFMIFYGAFVGAMIATNKQAGYYRARHATTIGVVVGGLIGGFLGWLIS